MYASSEARARARARLKIITKMKVVNLKVWFRVWFFFVCFLSHQDCHNQNIFCSDCVKMCTVVSSILVGVCGCREEREWRQWVDDKLVHVIPPNIYRSPGEAVQAFDYISRVSNFGNFERFAAKYIGAVSMYVLSKSLKKKYKLKPDVRQSLYDYCNKWTGAVGPSRKFMGGSEPNLADLVRKKQCYVLLWS